MVAALPAGRRAGQLRLAGQRSAGRDEVHRGAAHAAGDGDAARNRRGDSRFHPELRRPGAGADRPAQPVPQPAGQRLGRHRGRHGHQHAAAQPARARRGGVLVPRQLRGRRRGHAGGGHRAGQGAGLPDLRSDRRLAGHPRRLHHGPRVDPDARRRRDRGGLAAAARCSSSPSCRIRSTTTTSSPRSPSRSATASSPASPTSRTRAATASACASSSRSSATPWPRWC